MGIELAKLAGDDASATTNVEERLRSAEGCIYHGVVHQFVKAKGLIVQAVMLGGPAESITRVWCDGMLEIVDRGFVLETIESVGGRMTTIIPGPSVLTHFAEYTLQCHDTMVCRSSP
jgi:hypothetical protein